MAPFSINIYKRRYSDEVDRRTVIFYYLNFKDYDEIELFKRIIQREPTTRKI